jgi:hypothetical protein
MDTEIPEATKDEFEEIKQNLNNLPLVKSILKQIFSRFALKTQEYMQEFNRIDKMKTMAEAQESLTKYQDLYEKFERGWRNYLELKLFLKINDKNHCETLKEEEKLTKIIEKLNGKLIRKKN